MNGCSGPVSDKAGFTFRVDWIFKHRPTFRYYPTGSMSPMRGDVKEKFFPLPSEGRWIWRFASSPISDLEKLWVRDVLQTEQGSRRFLLDGFMTRWWFDAFGSGSYASKRGGSKSGQPWSYLRLEAYSFVGLCEGA